ncbi:hypothetical protein K461DRAFT_275990 [Myriangium duriaei CBS 260.36]|uniref:Uncharacterized protein n=1 Tax=Myriangium duriaei CBS 260.36 TaxID=1168546 RepID=A0A9P4MHJ2_9PEZI|nr:hypothetical protein K461DRAFT_275990 [Myriangium duriaei CBS 260.36]
MSILPRIARPAPPPFRQIGHPTDDEPSQGKTIASCPTRHHVSPGPSTPHTGYFLPTQLPPLPSPSSSLPSIGLLTFASVVLGLLARLSSLDSFRLSLPSSSLLSLLLISTGGGGGGGGGPRLLPATTSSSSEESSESSSW